VFDDRGAVFSIEAVLAATLLISVLALLLMRQPVTANDDSGIICDDVLNVLLYRGNTPAHPSLQGAFSSQTSWAVDSSDIDADVRSTLPSGTGYMLCSPYGDIGNDVPEGAKAYVRPFVVYGDTGVLEGRLVIWRM
jgi:hypothetical protein